MTSLKKQTITSVFWSFVERFSYQVIQFIIGIILARLLMPEDYGLIGMIAIFLSISNALIDGGFSQALIQKKETTKDDYNTVFIFNLFLSSILYITLFLLAPSIAKFYNTDALENLIRVVGLSFIISSFSIVQVAHLTKKLNFKLQTKITIAAIVISGLVAVSLAYYGFGVWALVIQLLLRNLINVILLFIYNKWTPILSFSKESFDNLFSFGSKLLGASLLNAIFNNLYYIVIGKYFNAQQLGYYTRANQFQLLPVETFTVILQRVTLPVMSKIQDDDKELRKYYKEFIQIAGFIIFPVMLSLAALAQPFILLILTKKWEATVILLQMLCFVGILYPIHAINLNLLKVKGRSDLFLKLEVIKKIIIIFSVIVTIPFGIKWLIIGQVITSIIFMYINTFYTDELIGYGFSKQIKDLFPIFILALFTSTITYLIIPFITNLVLQLIVGGLINIILYFFLSYILKFNQINRLRAILKI